MIVFGYHGTFEEAAQSMCQNEFIYKDRDYHWLGRGIYFFQDAPYRALEWAKNSVPEVKKGKKPAVIRAEIELKSEECIDLLDIRWFPHIKKFYNKYLEFSKEYSPNQISIKDLLETKDEIVGKPHKLDCAIINETVSLLAEQKIAIHAVRAAFLEGTPIISGSHLYDRAHIQIVVRDTGLSIIKKCSRLAITYDSATESLSRSRASGMGSWYS